MHVHMQIIPRFFLTINKAPFQNQPQLFTCEVILTHHLRITFGVNYWVGPLLPNYAKRAKQQTMAVRFEIPANGTQIARFSIPLLHSTHGYMADSRPIGTWHVAHLLVGLVKPPKMGLKSFGGAQCTHKTALPLIAFGKVASLSWNQACVIENALWMFGIQLKSISGEGLSIIGQMLLFPSPTLSCCELLVSLLIWGIYP